MFLKNTNFNLARRLDEGSFDQSESPWRWLRGQLTILIHSISMNEFNSGTREVLKPILTSRVEKNLYSINFIATEDFFVNFNCSDHGTNYVKHIVLFKLTIDNQGALNHFHGSRQLGVPTLDLTFVLISTLR